MNVIDLSKRYAAAFGMLAVGKAAQKLFVEKKKDQDYNFELYPKTNFESEYVKFTIPDQNPLEFSTALTAKTENVFAPPLLMTFSREKSLVKTEVNDDDFVVIERWGMQPWNIKINGLLIDLDNRTYPSDEIIKLNNSWNYKGVVEVVGKQFLEKGIDSIVFESIEFTPIEGFEDTIQFSISAFSIKSVNFTLLKPNSAKIITGDVTVEDELPLS
ncbi:DUF6046 domain-containing protein [Empedobacter brevis]|uniref:DUF6046 domain-containing protein n=1 Tax=Empedobacter brevis TaxID=247 RepID=UPI0039B0632A